MNCFQAGQLIEKYKLTGAEPGGFDFEMHLADCEDCNAAMEEARAYVSFMTESFRKMRPSDDFVQNVMHSIKHAPKTSLWAGTDVAPKRWRSGAEGVPGWRGAVLRLFMCWNPDTQPEKRFRHFMKVAAVLVISFFLVSYAFVLGSRNEPYRPDRNVRQQQSTAGRIGRIALAGEENLEQLTAGDDKADYYLEMHVDAKDPNKWHAIAMPKVPGVTGDLAYYFDDSHVVRFTKDGTVPHANSPQLKR